MFRSISVLLVFFALPIHAAITGTVVDASGAPIANARVVAFDPVLRAPRRDRTTLVATMSDAKGTFALDVPGRGVVDVSVRADGYAPADIVTAISDPAGTIVLTKANVVAFNITRPDGAPLLDGDVIRDLVAARLAAFDGRSSAPTASRFRSRTFARSTVRTRRPRRMRPARSVFTRGRRRSSLRQRRTRRFRSSL